MIRRRKRTVYLNQKWKHMLKTGFAADELTNPKSNYRAVTFIDFLKLEKRVVALEKRLAYKIKNG